MLIPGVSDAHARLPENCQKEALSLCLMRQETINGKGFSLQQVTRYIPLFRNIERKYLCTEFIPYPTDVFFIFLCVISTSAIYQYAARFQTRPDIRNNPPLPENLFKEADSTDIRSKGIKNVFVGIGLFIFLWAITEEFGLGCIGLLVMFTGFGQLVIYYTQQDRAPKSNDKSDNARTVFPEKNAEK